MLKTEIHAEKGDDHVNQGTMLNAYPDSIGNNMSGMLQFLSKPEMKDVFHSLYILPTVFNTDLDRGFSVISYDLCPSLATIENLHALRDMHIDLTFDFILNHLSVLSPQFQDILRNGDQSPYRDFFIDWNRFWKNCGEPSEDGVIHPGKEYFLAANLRKVGLPVLKVRLPDGRDVPYWNTFYQEVIYPELTVFDVLDLTDHFYDIAQALTKSVNAQLRQGCRPESMDFSGFETYREAVVNLLEERRRYLGQMDLNVQSPMVWKWYDQTLAKLAEYGASMVRLDAFTRLHKAQGRENFMNEPETWNILDRLKTMAISHGLEVLPEIHASYRTGAFQKLHRLGCPVYDYFLPALILDALETGDASFLYSWAEEIRRNGIQTVNMLGCHDGIPIRDPRGLLPDERVDALVGRLEERGGRRKMIHGTNPEVYQMDMTYYSALGCSDRKLAMARAIQMFMPGKPQVWYVDLLAGENDEEVFIHNPSCDNREINRHSYGTEEVEKQLRMPVVQEQLELLRMRNTHRAFADGAEVKVKMPADGILEFSWTKDDAWAFLHADLRSMVFRIDSSHP